jgi:hypothetical protein
VGASTWDSELAEPLGGRLGRDLAAEVRHPRLDRPAPGALALATLSSSTAPCFQDSNATAIWFLELGPTPPVTREAVPVRPGSRAGSPLSTWTSWSSGGLLRSHYARPPARSGPGGGGRRRSAK